MAKSFFTSINLNNNSLLNGRIDSRWASAPSGTTNPDGTGTAIAGQLSSYDGTIYVFNGTAWTALSTAGGTVSSVSGTTGSIDVANGSSTPVISLATAYGDSVNPYASKTGNYVLAAPNGSSGAPTFRALVAADIPTLNQNTTGSAGSVTGTLTFGTGLTAGGASFDGSAGVTISAVSGTTSTAGIVQLTDSTSSTSTTTAATPASVKAAYDLANAAMPKSGGTMSADLEMGTHKITGLGDPSADNDAANKKYVDDKVAGLTWKASVNLLATANIPLTGNTDTISIDGHATLTSTHDGYRLLLTAQSTAANKGIYLYTDNGTTYTLTRASDADTYQELNGATVFVSEGDTYGKTSWTQSNTYLSSFSGQNWVQFNGAQTYTAGDGLSASGNTFNVGGTSDRITVGADAVDIASTYVGQSSITTVGTLTSGALGTGFSTVDIAQGGTGATTAAAALTALGGTTKVTGAGTGTGTSIAVAHGLGTAVIAQLRDNTGAVVEVDIVTTSTASGTTTFTFSSSQTLSNFTYVIIG